MNFEPPSLLQINDESSVGAARRGAVALAVRLGFDEVDQGRVALVVTEASTNLLHHGLGGDLLFQACGHRGEADGIEITAVDHGPGIVDVVGCMRDGYSSGGTSGTGLGAIRRLADEFDLHSRAHAGTAVSMRLWRKGRVLSPVDAAFVASIIALPMQGEDVCGDAAEALIEQDRGVFMVVDGLGHGDGAAEAAQEAVRILRLHSSAPPAVILAKIHTALSKTRGAVIAIAEIDLRQNLVCYAGIGNINGYIETGKTMLGMVSHSGIIGHVAPRLREFTYRWTPASLLVMQSDGIKSRCYANDHPGLALRDPALIAGYTLHHGKRGADDATVLVARQSAVSGGPA